MALDLALLCDESLDSKDETSRFYASAAGYPDSMPLWFPVPAAPNLAMAVLSSTLKGCGYRVEIVDNFLRFPKALERLGRLLREERPMAVGLSTTALYDAAVVHEIVDYIRRECPQAKVILGGVSVQQHPELARLADVAVLCEGEEVVVEVLAALKSGGDLSGIRGISRRAAGSEGIVVAPPRDWYDMGRSPFPDWSHRAHEHSIYPLETQRGCPYACGFCTYRIYQGRRLRSKDTRRVLEEIRRNYELYSIKYYSVVDATFTVPIARCRELCEGMARLGLPLRWTCNARVEHMPALAEALHAAGCRGVLLGMESGDEGILRRMRKGQSLEQAREGVEACRKAGITTYSSFVIGYPGETEESLERTGRCLRESGVDFFHVQTLRVDARSPLRQDGESRLEGDGLSWRHETMRAADAMDRCFKLRLDALRARGPYLGVRFDLFNFIRAGLDFEAAMEFQKSRGYLLSYHTLKRWSPASLPGRGFSQGDYEVHLERARRLHADAGGALARCEEAYGAVQERFLVPPAHFHA